MSLLIHKPAHAILTARVLRAASNLNGNCWGLMGIGEDNALLMRRHHVLDVDALVALAQALKGAEYVLHLGQNARDGARSNVYPFEVSDGLYLMHSGTLPLKTRVLTKSSTWHLVHDLLRPVAIAGGTSSPSRLPRFFSPCWKPASRRTTKWPCWTIRSVASSSSIIATARWLTGCNYPIHAALIARCSREMR